jgi:cysteine desulfurase/selenocysteine lyase
MNHIIPVEAIRKDFPALNNLRNGKPPVYFDNACTTLVPRSVIDAMTEYYTNFPACGGGRSRHGFAKEVTGRIEGDVRNGITGSRQWIRTFINARSEKEILFTLNASHAINMVALGFRFKQGDRVLISDKEHNSNLVPWLRLEKLGRIKLSVLPSKADGSFDLDALEDRLKKSRVRLVGMGFTSNLTGYTLPAKEIVRLSHQYGACVLLDGAQTVPHKAVDVQDLDVDFLAFSLHKMCGPKGVGVLYGKQALLETRPSNAESMENGMDPVFLGGGTVHDSTYESYALLGPPDAFEVGVQNYAGLIGAGQAVQYLAHMGLDRIQAHEIHLNRFLTQTLLDDYGDTGWFKILGPDDPSERGGILTFEVRRPNAVGLTEELDAANNIMIRDGLFCVHSYLNHLYGQGWTKPKPPSEHKMVYRVSLYVYNTLEECRVFSDTLKEIFSNRGYL